MLQWLGATGSSLTVAGAATVRSTGRSSAFPINPVAGAVEADPIEVASNLSNKRRDCGSFRGAMC